MCPSCNESQPIQGTGEVKEGYISSGIDLLAFICILLITVNFVNGSVY